MISTPKVRYDASFQKGISPYNYYRKTLNALVPIILKSLIDFNRIPADLRPHNPKNSEKPGYYVEN